MTGTKTPEDPLKFWSCLSEASSSKLGSRMILVVKIYAALDFFILLCQDKRIKKIKVGYMVMQLEVMQLYGYAVMRLNSEAVMRFVGSGPCAETG